MEQLRRKFVPLYAYHHNQVTPNQLEESLARDLESLITMAIKRRYGQPVPLVRETVGFS